MGLLTIVGCSDASSVGATCDPNASGAGLEPGAPWATYRGDARHRGASSAVGPAQPVVRWTFTPPGSLDPYWPPAVASDGTLYVADVGVVYALGPGSQKWSLALKGRPKGSPTIGGDGTIYFSMSDLDAVSPQGKLLWSHHPAIDEVDGTAAIGPDGTLYVAEEARGLVALGAGGCERWRFDRTTATGVKTSPAIGSDGSVYFGIDGALVAVDPDGTEQWRYSLGDVEHLSPIVGSDGTIYAVTSQAVTALTPQGELKWEKTGVALGTQFPASSSSDSQLYLPSGLALTAFDASGAELWSADAGNTPPVVDVNGAVYTSDSSCVASAFAKDGTPLWSLPLTGNDGASCGSPVMGADGTLYFTSPSAGIIAVGGP